MRRINVSQYQVPHQVFRGNLLVPIMLHPINESWNRRATEFRRRKTLNRRSFDCNSTDICTSTLSFYVFFTKETITTYFEVIFVRFSCVCLSICPSVAYCQLLNCSPDFLKIRYGRFTPKFI